VGSGLDLVRDRIDEWRSDARFGVIVLVVVAVIAGVVWYRVGVSGDRDEPSVGSSAPTAPARPRTSAVPTTDVQDTVVVHVAGAVTHPGVAELPADSRVIDAVEAAGGALPDADLDRLNLAAKVADGERVLVPRVGEADVVDPALESSSSGDGAGGLLNLNTATAAQLEELPGIGPVLAAAILDERERRGGFRSVNELREVRGIGEKRFADLRDRVVV
jgi:competence protein ComEA